MKPGPALLRAERKRAAMDIVELLREPYPRQGELMTLLRRAADEIERLRAQIDGADDAKRKLVDLYIPPKPR